jgi:hypothetical protein
MDDAQQFYEALESIVESKHWRWMTGMTTDTGWLVVDPAPSAQEFSLPDRMMVMAKGERMALSAAYRLPDVEDPATQGCMLAIICDCVEALGGEPVTFKRLRGDRWVVVNDRWLHMLADGMGFSLALVETMSALFDLMDEQGVETDDTEKEREQAQEAQRVD